MDLAEYRRRIGRYFLSLEPSLGKKSMDFYNSLMSTATPEKEMLRWMNNKLDIVTDAVIKMQASLQGVTEEVSFLALCRVGETKNPPLPPCSVASTGTGWVPSADFFGDLLHCTESADAFPATIPPPPVPSMSVPPKQVESVPTPAVPLPPPLPSSASIANPHLDPEPLEFNQHGCGRAAFRGSKVYKTMFGESRDYEELTLSEWNYFEAMCLKAVVSTSLQMHGLSSGEQ